MQTYLAFDYGEKNVGVAVGNRFTKTAQALTIISFRNKPQLFLVINKLIIDWQPEGLVVGLPSYPRGEPHAMTEKALRFANQLRGRYHLSVYHADERYSSVAVDNGNDALAAQLLLEQFFIEQTD